MERKGAHVAIYPIPTPLFDEILIEVPLMEELEKVCWYLLEKEVEKETIQQLSISQHFQDLFAVTNLTYHVEILAGDIDLPAHSIWEKLHLLFPQFAWIQCCMERRPSNKLAYYLEFVPISHSKSEFPFEISLQESMAQQFKINREDAAQQAEEKILQLIGEALMTDNDSQNNLYTEETVYEPERMVDDADTKPTTVVPPVVDEDTIAIVKKSSEADILYLEEALKREKFSKERLRTANEQLELVVENLELSLLSNSIQYFEELDQNESEWYKRIRVDLREYTLLIQKAKYLEQMWQLNEQMVNKAEKMFIWDNQLIYERNQVTKIKSNYSASEINLVLYDCQLIESRSKVNIRPWFRRPNVKMLKMDYDNLLNKATYFDLLQGETYILEQAVRDRPTENVSKEGD